MQAVNKSNKIEEPLNNSDNKNLDNWTNFSDNYVSATSSNGFTVLASKSAAVLALGITRKKSLTKKST